MVSLNLREAAGVGGSPCEIKLEAIHYRVLDRNL